MADPIDALKLRILQRMRENAKQPLIGMEGVVTAEQLADVMPGLYLEALSRVTITPLKMSDVDDLLTQIVNTAKHRYDLPEVDTESATFYAALMYLGDSWDEARRSLQPAKKDELKVVEGLVQPFYLMGKIPKIPLTPRHVRDAIDASIPTVRRWAEKFPTHPTFDRRFKAYINTVAREDFMGDVANEVSGHVNRSRGGPAVGLRAAAMFKHLFAQFPAFEQAVFDETLPARANFAERAARYFVKNELKPRNEGYRLSPNKRGQGFELVPPIDSQAQPRTSLLMTGEELAGNIVQKTETEIEIANFGALLQENPQKAIRQWLLKENLPSTVGEVRTDDAKRLFKEILVRAEASIARAFDPLFTERLSVSERIEQATRAVLDASDKVSSIVMPAQVEGLRQQALANPSDFVKKSLGFSKEQIASEAGRSLFDRTVADLAQEVRRRRDAGDSVESIQAYVDSEAQIVLYSVGLGQQREAIEAFDPSNLINVVLQGIEGQIWSADQISSTEGKAAFKAWKADLKGRLAQAKIRFEALIQQGKASAQDLTTYAKQIIEATAPSIQYYIDKAEQEAQFRAAQEGKQGDLSTALGRVRDMEDARKVVKNLLDRIGVDKDAIPDQRLREMSAALLDEYDRARANQFFPRPDSQILSRFSPQLEGFLQEQLIKEQSEKRALGFAEFDEFNEALAALQDQMRRAGIDPASFSTSQLNELTNQFLGAFETAQQQGAAVPDPAAIFAGLSPSLPGLQADTAFQASLAAPQEAIVRALQDAGLIGPTSSPEYVAALNREVGSKIEHALALADPQSIKAAMTTRATPGFEFDSVVGFDPATTSPPPIATTGLPAFIRQLIDDLTPLELRSQEAFEEHQRFQKAQVGPLPPSPSGLPGFRLQRPSALPELVPMLDVARTVGEAVPSDAGLHKFIFSQIPSLQREFQQAQIDQPGAPREDVARLFNQLTGTGIRSGIRSLEGQERLLSETQVPAIGVPTEASLQEQQARVQGLLGRQRDRLTRAESFDPAAVAGRIESALAPPPIEFPGFFQKRLPELTEAFRISPSGRAQQEQSRLQAESDLKQAEVEGERQRRRRLSLGRPIVTRER